MSSRKTKTSSKIEKEASENPIEQQNVALESAQQVTEDFAQTDNARQEVEQLVDEIVASPAPKRVWEVDFLRGLMILFVVWDHFMWDVSYTGPFKSGFFGWLYTLSGSYYTGALRKATHDIFVTLFVFTSGVSCSFSRSNGRRAVKMMAFALLFTAVTYAISSVLSMELTIYFNVIHVIAMSVAIWSVVEWLWSKCTKAWQKNLFGAIMAAITIAVLVVGACAKISPWTNDSPLWYFLAEHKGSAGYNKFTGADYLPFLPDFGWFLIGAFLGRLVYKERKSLFPSVSEKWVSPVTFCGRHSIWIYFGSQVLMFGFFYLFGKVWKIL